MRKKYKTILYGENENKKLKVEQEMWDQIFNHLLYEMEISLVRLAREIAELLDEKEKPHATK